MAEQGDARQWRGVAMRIEAQRGRSKASRGNARARQGEARRGAARAWQSSEQPRQGEVGSPSEGLFNLWRASLPIDFQGFIVKGEKLAKYFEHFGGGGGLIQREA